jgi:hypothetical protein
MKHANRHTRAHQGQAPSQSNVEPAVRVDGAPGSLTQVDAQSMGGGERLRHRWVHRPMSIDKDSTGRPEVDISRRTTKVNLSIVIGVGLFFALTFGLVWWFARR